MTNSGGSGRRKEVHSRVKKTSRRHGSKIGRSFICVGEDGFWPLSCMRRTDSRMASCLPPELRHSQRVRDLIEVRKTVTL